jgi:hypothetical protein
MRHELLAVMQILALSMYSITKMNDIQKIDWGMLQTGH